MRPENSEHRSSTWALLVGTVIALAVLTGLGSAQNPVPFISQPLVPGAATPGGAAFTLTVNGTGFVSNSVVKWNGNARTTTFVNSSQLKANILASDIAQAGTAAVTVVSPGPGGSTSNVAFFEVTVPGASIGLSMPSEFGVPGISYGGIAIGDFNHDGKLDLAETSYAANGNLSILLGNGDGTFQPAVNYTVGANPQSVAVGDFNRDGHLDLAVANPYSNNVSILLGNGDGTFQAAVNYSAGSYPLSVAVGDFNRDGKLDLVTNGSILLGNGDGTFQAAVNYSAPSSVWVAVGDFNHDGNLDLAVVNGVSVGILLGNGDGTFQAAVNYSVGISDGFAYSVAVGDFSRDGNLDLAVSSEVTLAVDYSNVSILLGNGDGTFRSAVNYPGGSVQPLAITVGDLNGDGRLDLVVANGGGFGTLIGNGNGTFQPVVEWSAASPSGVALGDFNGDGRLDVAGSDGGDAAVSVLLQIPAVALSKMSLAFAPQLIRTRSASQTVTLANGGFALTISSITLSGTNATDYSQTNTCGSGLAPGGKCRITVSFTPTQIGPRTASIVITDNAAGSSQSIALSGTGVVSGPNVTLSTTSLTFVTQLVGTTSPAQSVTLSNYGTQALSIASIIASGDFQQTNTCDSSLAVAGSCTINVTFTPTQKGSRTGTVTIKDDAAGSLETVSLNGTGTVVELSPASLHFHDPVGTGTTQSTTLTNVGSTALSIAHIAIAGADADEFRQTNTCGTGVGAGKSCTITVTFTPTEQGGDSAEVSISDNGGGSPQQVGLSGVGCVWEIVHNHRKCLPLSQAVQAMLAKSRSTAVPSVMGVNRVGTRIIDLVDSSRTDPFATNGLKRELLVRFWYPASAKQDCKLADYTSRRVWNYFAELTRLPLPAVTTNSCLNAPVAEGEYPVVVFTHGYTGTFTDYTFLFEELASRGYIIVSIDHTYEATAVEFPDQRFVKSLVGSHLANTWQTDEQTLSSALSVRLDDLKFVLSELERLNGSTGNPFAGKLDLTRLALAGHSLGGLSAWFGVQRDARFKAGVLLDPYLLDIPLGSTETPVMLLTMGREQRSEDECQLWSELHGPRLAVNLQGAEHVTPSDAVWLAKGAIKTGPMGPEKTIAAVRDYIAAFLDANLRGRPASRLLAGPSSEYPDADVTTQEQPLCRRP